MFFEENEFFEEENYEKDRGYGAEKHRLDAKHKKRKLDIIENVPCWKNGLINSRNGKYYTHSNFRKKPSKKRANKKVRKTEIGNACNYKKVYDVEWECS